MGGLGALIDPVKTWREIDIVLAVLAAGIVAYGVLFLGWSVFVVIALFWFENVVIGIFNVAKILISGARGGGFYLLASLGLAAFFTVHYGLFTVVHGVFVVTLFGQSELGSSSGSPFAPLGRMLGYLLADRDGWLAAVGVTMLQAAAFFRWCVNAHDSEAPQQNLMAAPYGRIVILHVTILAGGALVSALQWPVVGALLLVALKLAFDLVAVSSLFNKKPPAARPSRPYRFAVPTEDDARHP